MHRKFLMVAICAALAAPLAGTIHAQETAASSNDSKDKDAEAKKKAKDMDGVTVTGSLIQRDTFSSVSPVQVITREESTLAGFSSTTGILQSTGVTNGSAQINNAYGGYVTNGGPGANTLSLRGLGATRTLILLNGRRVAPAGSRGSVGSADLNVLPNAMVDHIEILKEGASSLYGSDAVAGVVNIITKKQMDGVTLEGQYNATEHGGGDETRFSIAGGKTTDRWSLSGSLEAYKRTNLTLADRDWTRCNTDYRRNLKVGDYWGSGDTIDPMTGQPKCYPITGTGSNGVTINTIGTNNITGVPAAGATGTTFNRWRPNSGVTTGLVGFEGVGGGQTTNTNIRDTFDPRTLKRSLISPAETKTGFLQGSYKLNALGDGEIYFELLGNKRDSSQVGFRQLSLDYAKGSPLIPSTLAGSTFSSAPTNITNGKAVGVRAFIGYGNDSSTQTVDFWKATTGLRGQFFSPDWHYDFMLSKAHSSADYTMQSFLTDRLAQSLDVVADGKGGFVCRNTANGCIAAPKLSTDVIAGRLPQNWVNWVMRPITGNTLYEESTANLTLSGSLFHMPFGDVHGAFGMEYRHAKINDQPDPNSVSSNLYGLTSSAVTRGTDSVREVYGEVEFPLLAGLKGAEELTLDVSGRYTDYHSYGSQNTYKIGGIYTPIHWLSLRASYGTSYRAPALFEQFLGATSGFLNSSIDPCNDYGSDPGTARAKNCASEGLPPNFQANSSVQVLTQGGRDAGLKAETSKNLNAGIILQPTLPSYIGDVSFAMDYFKVKVNNGVSRAGAANILQLCYDSPDFRAGGGFCRLVDPRTPGSNALTVHDSYVNLATDLIRGYDFTVRYDREIGIGQFRATAQVTRFLEQSSKLFADDPLVDYNGMLNTPKWSGTLDATYKVKDWTVRYGMNWVGDMQSYDYYKLNPATSAYKLNVPNYFTHELSVQYSVASWSATAGVRNLMDKTPPSISSGYYNRVGNAPLYSGYDYLGRTFFLNVSKSL